MYVCISVDVGVLVFWSSMCHPVINAEIHSYNNYLKAYRSDVGGNNLITKPPLG